MVDKIEGFKCRFCKICNGHGCVGMMPGMGGPNMSCNFIANCRAWKKYEPLESDVKMNVRLAPMTGAVENVGYPDERRFYFDLIKACADAGFALSIGDGCPDFKLQYGIEAVDDVRRFYQNAKAAVFIKPYADEKILERCGWAFHVAEAFGIDIDSYNIITMRNQVHLEKKTAGQLGRIKKELNAKGFRFIIKGVFTEDDLELVREVKPDVVYVSNHGGRVETRKGSTAGFLSTHSKELLSSCGELWADGGIRTVRDIQVAASFGVSTVLLGRPFASALCKDKELGIERLAKKLSAVL